MSGIKENLGTGNPDKLCLVLRQVSGICRLNSDNLTLKVLLLRTGAFQKEKLFQLVGTQGCMGGVHQQRVTLGVGGSIGTGSELLCGFQMCKDLLLCSGVTTNDTLGVVPVFHFRNYINIIFCAVLCSDFIG